MAKPIYLDYNATTPVDPAVRDAMLPYLDEHFGNPSTTHAFGSPVKNAIEKARGLVSSLIGASKEEVIFTSGGSESDNHAIIGAALANSGKGKRIITMRIEHPAVLNTCRYLEETMGFEVVYLPVDKYGIVNPEDIRRAITEKTIIITIMHANNEVGTIEPIAEIGKIAREYGILFHTDAAQSCGKIRVDVNELKVDMLTIAGHKLYAPKGIGALFVRRGTQIDSLIHGAGQENGRRAGTENVPYIVALGKACELTITEDPAYAEKIESLRDRLFHRITNGLGKDKVKLNGHSKKRLPNTLNISIKGIVSEDLLRRIPELAVSTGAACHAGSNQPSSVLLEMGVSREMALGALRLTLGRWTTSEEIDTTAALILERSGA